MQGLTRIGISLLIALLLSYFLKTCTNLKQMKKEIPKNAHWHIALNASMKKAILKRVSN